MSTSLKNLLLVGDNPFHGISHLSEDRARARGNEINKTEYAAKLVKIALDNGASGFMFSVSETTLSILRTLDKTIEGRSPRLFAIVPYAYEYVRLATHLGTIGLAKRLSKQILLSGNMGAISAGIKSVTTMNPKDFLKAYLHYELNRIKTSHNKNSNLESVMLHEVITEMILSLNLYPLAKKYVDLASDFGFKPGFETRNFAYFVKKFEEWKIDFSKIAIATPLNKIGFQMNPSRQECEEALLRVPDCTVIAMSTLASGYLTLNEAVEYLKTLPNVSGAVIGVSKEKQAKETFEFLKLHLA